MLYGTSAQKGNYCQEMLLDVKGPIGIVDKTHEYAIMATVQINNST